MESSFVEVRNCITIRPNCCLVDGTRSLVMKENVIGIDDISYSVSLLGTVTTQLRCYGEFLVSLYKNHF